MTTALFWLWWLAPARGGWTLGRGVATAGLAWLFLLGAYFLFFACRITRPNPALPVPELRVAIVVTKAPSEPWAMVEKTLRAMLDAGPALHVRRLARRRAPERQDAALVQGARRAGVHPAGGRRVPPAHLAAADQVQGRQPRLLLRQVRLRPVRRRGPARRRPRAGARLPEGDGAAVRRPGHRLRRGAERLRRQRGQGLDRQGPAAPRGVAARSGAGRLERRLRPAVHRFALRRAHRRRCGTSVASGPSWPRTTPPRCGCSRPGGTARSPSTPRRTATAPRRSTT